MYLSPGKGLHSDGGLSKLRPRLAELCDEYVETLWRASCILTSDLRRELTYSLDPRNAGKLIVRLR